jgi:integrase
MPRLIHAVPKYRNHRASGQAIVTIAGQDHYLGPYGCKSSHMLYDRLIAEFLSADRRPQTLLPEESKITLVEVLAAYWKFCKSYYIKNGNPTNEQEAFKLIIRDVKALYSDLPAEEFGPKSLKAVRQKWIERGHCRSNINKNMRRLTRLFKWAVSEEFIPPSVYQALATVPGLKKGRCAVPEAPPVMPVELACVERTLVHLPRIVAQMVRLQLLTGMRPGEVCRLRPCDIDRDSAIWEYRPQFHKTEHHDRCRVVYVGPAAQLILQPFLDRDEQDACFSPQENMLEHLKHKHSQRITPLSCGNRPGTNRKSRPKKQPGNRYDPNSYRRAIHRACDLAFPAPEPLCQRDKESKKNWRDRLTAGQREELAQWQSDKRWSPNQLRHTAATRIRKEFGLEAAQVILGHAAADVTQVYAERDADKAREVVRQIG